MGVRETRKLFHNDDITITGVSRPTEGGKGEQETNQLESSEGLRVTGACLDQVRGDFSETQMSNS